MVCSKETKLPLCSIDYEKFDNAYIMNLCMIYVCVVIFVEYSVIGLNGHCLFDVSQIYTIKILTISE